MTLITITVPRTLRRISQPRLVLADDHRMVLESLSHSLSERHIIAGAVSCGAELLAFLKNNDVDCILLDLDMPGTNGIELIAAIRRLSKDARIVVLTMHADRSLAEAAQAAGALGYVPKDAPLSELEVAIAEVLAGRRFISPRIPKSSHRVGLDARHLALQRLTPRQQEIVLLFGEGKTASDIATRLDVSQSTITFHKQNIMKVLGMKTDGELFQFSVLVWAGVQRD